MMRIGLLLAGAALAWGQAPRYGSIAGVVLDGATGAPRVRAVVTLETKAEKPANAVAWTNARGAFSFSGVPPGSYYLYRTRRACRSPARSHRGDGNSGRSGAM
jgi:hypothetical protein